MPFYRVQRHVVWDAPTQGTLEVWGIDRPALGLRFTGAPRFTDECDPLSGGCPYLLLLKDGSWVTWDRIFEWMSEAEEAGYTVVSGLEKLTPYSTIVIAFSTKDGDHKRTSGDKRSD